MTDKIGRNDPCPCGSGKKYKKCCGFNKIPDFSLPEDMKTGTMLDEYMMLFQGVVIFGQGIKQFGDDRKALNEAIKDFESRFRPGEPGGVSDGIFMTWQYFDLRFGKKEETICGQFINSGFANGLREPAPRLLQDLAQSYLTFYEVKGVLDDWIVFEEIGTGKDWKIHRINEPFEREAKPGDVWYVRFIGGNENGYIYTAPYIFPSKETAYHEFFKAMLTQKNVFARYTKEGLSEEEIFRRSCKESVRYWVECFLRGSGSYEAKPMKAVMPVLYNDNWMEQKIPQDLNGKFKEEEFLSDFKNFLAYITKEKIKLTPKCKWIPMKHLYAINNLFRNPSQLDDTIGGKVYRTREEFRAHRIYFMDLLAEASECIVADGRDLLAAGPLYNRFLNMDGFNKKRWLVLAWYFHLDWDSWMPEGDFGKTIQEKNIEVAPYIKEMSSIKHKVNFKKFTKTLIEDLNLKWNAPSQSLAHDLMEWGIERCILEPLSWFDIIRFCHKSEGKYDIRKVKDFYMQPMGRVFLEELVKMGEKIKEDSAKKSNCNNN